VPSERGLRPTTDRVRETLFNWLAPDISGSRCLDCFAGSGALGFEAFSRGAAEVVLLERAKGVAARLRENAAQLSRTPDGQAGRIEVICTDALRWLATAEPKPFDIVFLDPPFEQAVIGRACELLRRGWLAAQASIYLENPASEAAPPLPADWRVARERVAGQVRYALARVQQG
jgi:16S rRNA (guanine966-N2)-methyltransferase